MVNIPQPRQYRQKCVLKAAFFQAQKKRMQEGYPLLGNHTQQPFEVVTRRTQHGMQLVAVFTLKVAATHPVIRFQMANDRFNGLAAFQLLSFQRRQPLGLASMHNAHLRIVGIHAPVTQVYKDRVWSLRPRVRQFAAFGRFFFACFL